MAVTPVALTNEGALLLEGKDADQACVVPPERMSLCSELGIYVVFGRGVLNGTVVVECAPHANFNGAWATLQTIRCVGENKAHYYGCTGAHLAIRVRIGKAIQGGVVSVYGVAN